MRLSKTIILFLLMLFYSTSYIQSTNLDLVNEAYTPDGVPDG